MLNSGKKSLPLRFNTETPERLSRLGFINKQTLQFTFELFRDTAPASALLIQNVLASEHLKLDQSHLSPREQHEAPQYYRVEIDPTDIVKILGQLTHLGSEAVANHNQQSSEERRRLRRIIRDWTHIGDWVIQRALGLSSHCRLNPDDADDQ